MSKKKQPDPEKERIAEIIEFHKNLKNEVRSLINTYAPRAQHLGRKFPDPHAAIIAALQVAIAEAGCQYLLLCGAKPDEAFKRTVQTAGVSMQNWVQTILKKNDIKATVQLVDNKFDPKDVHTVN